ncbi:MAG: polyprenyl synthetase family protein [Sphaerobacter sp.]|nr:polyprenyl synthetase family protein [Sphaerobacter sp.]
MNEAIADVERAMRQVVAEAESATAHLFSERDLPLYGVLRYHLGWAEQDFRPGASDPGKRIRPQICLLCCMAAGGSLEVAVPTAASIELLHNFTLIHDDVQDQSMTRRHRPTVWALWGTGQAINAGDALFALSQLPLLTSMRQGVPAERVVHIAREFNTTVLRIVEGQVLDLGYEERWDIPVDAYLAMIEGKTASLVGFAAWAGAVLAGADPERAERYRAFGRALGLGFQLRDDVLGIWGDSQVTGKPSGDDIRRRKKSLPVLLLAAKAAPAERDELRAIYGRPEVSEEAVARILDLMQRYNVQAEVQVAVAQYHEEARRRLDEAGASGPARERLEALAEQLATRRF